MPQPCWVMPTPPVIEGSALLRSAREAAGLTRSEAARRSATSRAALHRYETGTASPTLEVVIRILRSYGMALRCVSEDEPAGP